MWISSKGWVELNVWERKIDDMLVDFEYLSFFFKFNIEWSYNLGKKIYGQYDEGFNKKFAMSPMEIV